MRNPAVGGPRLERVTLVRVAGLVPDDWSCDSRPAGFEPERRDPDLAYTELRCRCGGALFRLAGRPRVAEGRGPFFLRTLGRIWREARIATKDGEPVESPFRVPVVAFCEGCGSEAALLRIESRHESANRSIESEPRESIRCRVCRRGRFELALGQPKSASPTAPVLFAELVAHCHACRRQARIAWIDERPSEQALRLDALYGRR